MVGRAIAAAVVTAAVTVTAAGPAARAQTIRVDTTLAHLKNTFRPTVALGAGIDRMSPQATDVVYSAAQLQQVLAAGYGTVSYRLNTELHVEAWHWNPQGTWSDPAVRGGYFTGDAKPGAVPIRHSWGYALPHRGVTRDDGTDANGFGRLTDGDRRTYWKSNPYLAPPYLVQGQQESALPPQWIVVDLERPQPVDAIRIAWAAPFARAFTVEHWTGADAIKKPTEGHWQAFPTGVVRDGRGGAPTTILAPHPIDVRFVRVTMTNSSGTCDSHGAGDRRNCLGYAISEIYLGRRGPGGRLRDAVIHTPGQKQTVTYASSTDPWHQAADKSPEHGEQSGLDLFFSSGVTRGLPAMIPVSVLYGTPEDSAAQLAYLKARGYPISHVELGEEPDGHYMTPEHYGALYLQWATALHAVDPTLKLGGPAFTGTNEDVTAWPDASGDGSWLGRFLKYLRAQGRLADLAFFSFEHYPYDPCQGRWEDLYEEPRLIAHIMDVWRKDGLPADVPLLITEVNVAWQSGQRFVDIFGALWLADYTAAFLTAGGAASYFFHYLPLGLGGACDGTRGTFSLHVTDDQHRIKQPLAQFFASQLLTQHWVVAGDAFHRLFSAASDVRDAAGHTLVTAYAVARPDGQWSLLLINKDHDAAHDVRVTFQSDGEKREHAFAGSVAVATFGSAQYQWHAGGDRSHAQPDGPLVTATAPGGAGARYSLPAASVTVLHAKID